MQPLGIVHDFLKKLTCGLGWEDFILLKRAVGEGWLRKYNLVHIRKVT